MDLDKCLHSTYFFDFHKKKVNQKALKIIEGLRSPKEKVVALFYWVRDKIKYKQGSFYLTKSTFKASNNIRRGYGFCVSKAVLLSTLARAVGIPARIHLADIINHKIPQKVKDYMKTDIFYIHGYSELYLNGKWVKATPAFDKDTSNKGGYILVEFDGERDALFSECDEEGNKFVEYLKDRGVYDDVPYKEICQVIMDKYKPMLQNAFKSKNLDYS